ncbi:lipase family protein [Nocardia sp. NBC_00881]|uniref:lipase family protein n=1 Tax=Nocardia sp. NBC_00881 TaxID=2975995 RepID=UPI00386D2992|nr:lipase family protein [Nocardia sp. NBC_00881]
MTDPAAPDGFYSSPALDFAPRPGEILRRRTVSTPHLHGASRAWQLVYATRTAFSAPIPASGIMITPHTAEFARRSPVLVYCTAFHGLGGRCAPSQLLAGEGSEPETRFIATALERGWTVAVPDDPGLGMTGLGPHQFLAGRAAAHAVLDLARAVRALSELDSAQAPCAVWGYADGGRAAVWAAEQQPRYAPELDLRGVAAGAVVADPGALVAEIDGGRWAGLGLAGLVGLSRAYAHLPVGHILTDDGHRTVQQAQELDAAALLATYRNQPLGRWCERPDPWNDPLWRYVLANETSGRVAPQVPVHLYHGTEDALVPVAMGRGLFAEYRSLGVAVSWREYATSHTGTAAEGAADAITSLASYLQHRPNIITRPAPPSPQTT